MQILFAWKSRGLAEAEAVKRWALTLESWKNTYQPLVDAPLYIAMAHTKTLFLGLISVQNMFLEWQEFYQDDSYAVAWSGISYNLLDTLPQGDVEQMNTSFVSQVQSIGDSFLRGLDGRFIVSALNQDAGTLQIITNKSGVTPCFLTEGKHGIAVGTRIAPLIDLVGGKYTPNRTAMLQLFAFDWCLGSHTPFKGVFQVEPGMRLLLQEHESTIKELCYFPPQKILEQATELSKEDYFQIGSDALNLTITRQMRHAKAPLMNLTGGMDTRTIVASAVALGYHPECDVSGTPGSKEIEMAARVAEAMNITLHRLYPGTHDAENLEETLRLWNLWTEGTIPIYNGFARSAMALSLERRKFFAPYSQFFSGQGGICRGVLYGPEMLAQQFSPGEIVTRLLKRGTQRYHHDFLSDDDKLLIRNDLQKTIDEAIRLGLTSPHEWVDYFYLQERVMRWGGFAVDSQQFGRHVFTPLCQSLLFSIDFSMSAKEKLSGAWHRYHIQRMFPAIAPLPFLHPPLFQGVRKVIFTIHPALYTSARYLKDRFFSKHQNLPIADQDKLGTYFHPYLQKLLFSGSEWWPNIIQYEHGQRIWDNFVRGIEVKPLWNLVTFELWARNFLS